MPGPGERVDVGRVDITVTADRRGIVDSFRKGATEAAGFFGRSIERSVTLAFGGRAGAVFGLLRGAGPLGGVGVALGARAASRATGAAAVGAGAAVSRFPGIIAGGGAMGGAVAGAAVGAPGGPVLMIALAAATAAVTVGFIKLTKAGRSLIREADLEIGRLARVSPGLSAVQVQSEVFQLLRDIRRASGVQRELIDLRNSIERTKNNLQDLGNVATLVKVKIAGFGANVAAGATQDALTKIALIFGGGTAGVFQALLRIGRDIHDAVRGIKRASDEEVVATSLREANSIFMRDLDAISGRFERGRPTMFPDPDIGPSQTPLP